MQQKKNITSESILIFHFKTRSPATFSGYTTLSPRQLNLDDEYSQPKSLYIRCIIIIIKCALLDLYICTKSHQR